MSAFTPAFLAASAAGHWTCGGPPRTPVTGFSIDSRTLRPGELFIALKTPARDGHTYLPAALAAGASAALVSTPNPALSLPQLAVADTLLAFQAIAAAWRRRFTGPVIGITGSAGKTSTKDLLACLLSATPGDTLATAGNLNNHLGVPLTLLRLDPDNHRQAVIEAGIGGPDEMAPLAAMIEPDLAIVTLIAAAHLEALGTLDGVAREKARLPAGARPDALKLFPASCLAYAPFRELARPTQVVSPAISHSGDTTFVELELGGSRQAFPLRRVSEGMASNAALALTAAHALGVPPATLRARLADWRPATLRGEIRRDALGRWLYVDCYNANPASMHDALATFCATAPVEAPRLLIIGGMEELGAETDTAHRQLGAALSATLRPGDSALVLAAASAAVVAGAAHPAVVSVPDIAALRARLEDFRGAVFVKGSRRYRLETLLAPAADDLAAPAH